MGGSAFSTRLLPRLALRHMEMWNEKPMSASGHFLENNFCSESEIQEETNLTGVALAPKCRIGMLELQEGDLIMWGPNCEKTGTVHFLENDAEPYVYLSQYECTCGTAAIKKFRATNNKIMHKWSALDHPKICSWWRQDKTNSHARCLP